MGCDRRSRQGIPRLGHLLNGLTFLDAEAVGDGAAVGTVLVSLGAIAEGEAVSAEDRQCATALRRAN